MLGNLKILDFTTLLPGPYATSVLNSMGASVTRVVAPGKSDLVLESGPKAADGETANRKWLTYNKDEIIVDLKTRSGVETIRRLIKEEYYNCIFEQFRPGVMEKFGLGYEDIKEISPEMIYVSITGYGQYGEYRDKASHDINYLALSGNMSYSGREDGGPVLYGMQIADIAASQNAVIGTLAAHSRRMLDGRGARVDISILDSVIPFNAMSGVGTMMSGEEPKREGTMLNGGSMYDFYETSDGQYMSVGALEPKFWKRFCEVMGHEEWIEAGCVCDDFREKKEILRADFKKHTRDYWEEKFENADACVEPVLSIEEALLKRSNAKERGSVINTAEADGTENGVWIYGNPIKFTR